jgi:chromosome partitioning protein
MPIVVAFVSQKGGVGKSTLARALASVAAHGGLKVTLADLDRQQQTLMQWQRARKADNASPKITVAAFDGVSEALAAAGHADLLILDTPGHVNRSTLDIARHTHLIVQPTGASADDLHPTALTFHELVGAGVPKSRMVAALCRLLSEDEEEAARSYLADAGYEALPGWIPESASYRLAQNHGRSVTETIEKSLNAHADALMEALLMKVAALMESSNASAAGAKKGDVA